MEPCNDKYSSRWNNDLYIYTDRSMCYDNNYGCYYHNAGNTDLYADRTSLPEQCSTCTSCNIRQWLCRNLEPCYDKYSNSWNDILYIHSNRSMCDSNDDGYCGECTGNTNLYADWTSLPEQCSTC